MTLFTGHAGVIETCLVVAWAIGLRCAAMDLSEMEELLGSCVAQSLERAHLTVKEAAGIMEIDASPFGKALRGEVHRLISLNHLIKLPLTFWLHFAPALMWLVAKRHARDIAETVAIRKGA